MAEDLFALADRRLAWLDQRQNLLAQNVANADTPNYRARDLAPFAAHLTAADTAGQPTRTSPLHLAGASEGASLATTPPAQIAANGNSVQLEGELVKVANTDSNQEMVSDLYRKYLNLYRTALGR